MAKVEKVAGVACVIEGQLDGKASVFFPCDKRGKECRLIDVHTIIVG
jgi:hypothetical protein